MKRILSYVAAAIFLCSIAACTEENTPDIPIPTPPVVSQPAGSEAPSTPPSTDPSSADPSTSESGSANPSPTAIDTGSGTVKVATSDQFGQYLTDAQGRALYMFDRDQGQTDKTVCEGECLVQWPLFVAKDNQTPAVEGGVDESKLGVNADGQVFYGNYLLYYWFKDESPTDTKGQAVGGVWWLVAPDGTKITTEP